MWLNQIFSFCIDFHILVCFSSCWLKQRSSVLFTLFFPTYLFQRHVISVNLFMLPLLSKFTFSSIYPLSLPPMLFTHLHFKGKIDLVWISYFTRLVNWSVVTRQFIYYSPSTGNLNQSCVTFQFCFWLILCICGVTELLDLCACHSHGLVSAGK